MQCDSGIESAALLQQQLAPGAACSCEHVVAVGRCLSSGMLSTPLCCAAAAVLLLLLQAEAEAADIAKRQRLQALAEEVKQFNEIKMMQLTEQERQER